jgi:MOSC domain-containing protein YiiM
MRASSSSGQDSSSTALVARLAVRNFDPSSSKPSSRGYITRKDELSSFVNVTLEGCYGDYNHYRTVALRSTRDRAVSLLTEDVMKALRSQYPEYDIQDGDLGENLYVANASYHFFRIGERYEFVSPDPTSPNVILEITEKMTPCANLCKLSYINQESLQPKQRIVRCQEFLAFLDRYDGYRGWYAKVVQEGVIRTGSRIRRVSYS